MKRTIALLVVTAFWLGVGGCAPALGRMAVKTPNHGKTAAQLEECHLAEPDMQGAGIDHRFRVSGDDAEISLSVWVIDPSNEQMFDNEQGLWFAIPDRETRQKSDPHSTLLILHGYRHYKNDWAYLMWARHFAEHGYRVVLVDLRGHGASTGDWSGFGPREALDLVQVVDELERRELLVGKLGVFGASYGGATAIHLAGIEPRVRAVVTVSALATMRSVIPSFVKVEMGWFSGLAGVWGWDNIVNEAGRAGGFDPNASDARLAIRQTRAPVLLTHSIADRHVLPAEAEALDRAGGLRVNLELMDGGGHFDFGVKDAGRLRQAALIWFNLHLK